MQIKCPECGFTREVNSSQIPASSSFATCPKCSVRFRFRAEPDPIEPATDEAKAAAAAKTHEEAARPGGDEPKEGDIWASMDKMRQDWEEIDREDEERPKAAPKNTPGAKPNAARPEPHDESPGGAGSPDMRDSPDFPNYEDEARLREEADRAYRQAAGPGGKIPLLSTVGSVPWEYRGGFLNPLVFLRTIILMVTRLPQFFSGINPYSSIFPSWIFLLVVRGVQMGVAMMNTKLVSTLPDGSQQILAVHEVAGIPSLVFMSICMITLIHFMGSFIVNYAIQTLARSKANFRLTFKTMAYANMPVLLSIIPGVGSPLAFFVSLVLLFMGIRYAYGFNWRKTAVSVLPYLILSLLFLLMMFQAAMG